jgi:MYXO-CTERM domain-containing protein
MRSSFLLRAAVGAAVLLASPFAAAQPYVGMGPVLPSVPVPGFQGGVPSAIAYGAGVYMAVAPGVVRAFDASGSPLAPTPTFIDDTSAPGSPRIAFDGTNFRTFSAEGAGNAFGVRSAIVSPSGTLLRSTGLVPGATIYAADATCGASGECAVAWRVSGGPDAPYAGVEALRIDANGDPIDATPIVVVPGMDSGTAEWGCFSMTAIASGYLLGSGIGPTTCVVQAFDSSFKPLAAGITLSTTSVILAGSSAGALALTDNGAIRFDGTGKRLDTKPIHVVGATATATSSGYAVDVGGSPPAVTEIAFDGTVGPSVPLLSKGTAPALSLPAMASDGTHVFFLSSGNSSGTGQLYDALLGSDGSLVLPLTAVSGGYASETHTDIAWDGESFLAGWLRQSVVGLSTVSPAGQTASLPTYPHGAADLAIGSNGSGYALWLDDSYQAELDLATSLSATPATVANAPQYGLYEGLVSIASDGSHYLGVYSYPGGSGAPGGADVSGTLVDADGGSSSTSTIAIVSTTDDPDYPIRSNGVAWSGSSYAVVWVNPLLGDTKGAFCDASGKVIAGPMNVDDGTGGSVEASVACGAGSCVYAWTDAAGGISTRAFSASGTPSAPPKSIAGTSGLRAPRLAWDGKEYVLVAAQTQVGPADLVGTWLDASGAPLESGLATLASGVVATASGLRLAPDGAGNTAVAFTRFADQRAVVYVLTSTPPVLDAGTEGGSGEAGAPEGGTPDSGPVDAGSNASDAGGGPSDAGDAGGTKGGAGEASGCGCSEAGAAAPGLPAVGLLGLMLFALGRRRRATL